MATLPKLIRFLLAHCLIGIAAGGLLLAGLLGADIGGLGTLVRADQSPILVVALLAFLFAITFGSMAMGTAIFMLRSDPPDGARRYRLMPGPAPAKALR